MTQEPRALSADLDAVIGALRRHERFCVASHESPDGDALGSMLGMALCLRALGYDTVMYLGGGVAFPPEYAFLPLAQVLREPPADIAERVLVAVDCANARRLGPDPAVLERAALVVNIDHHHDNSRFGAVNFVAAEASSTAEIVADVACALGVELTPPLAEALYVGLVTDTGRFQYANTTAKALRLAATLVDAGADLNAIFRHVYETVPVAKLKLLGRALSSVRLHLDGRVVIAQLLRSDFTEAGAVDPYADGVIDLLRQAEGSELVALMREPLSASGPARRVSLRSSTAAIDVSAIARQRGGGGHRMAAGFSSDESFAEIEAFICEAFLREADAPAAGG
jgi:bifunctional oligoribonuclease and PAP phosphatase NrnA